MKIKEIIIVEGKSDTAKINQAVQADTLETNGSALSEDTLKRIELAQQRRGVIVFTDPDYPGERIRKLISERVKGVKHAFLAKHEAKEKKGKGLGVEHASVEAIRTALLTVKEEMGGDRELISWPLLIQLDLIGGSDARERREQLGKQLNIGYMNAKQLYKRLRMFQITQEELYEALEVMRRGSNNE